MIGGASDRGSSVLLPPLHHLEPFLPRVEELHLALLDERRPLL